MPHRPRSLVLIGVRPADDEPPQPRLLDRLLKYRVFADDAGKMNLSLRRSEGDLLLVPQFTLAAEPARDCGRDFPPPRRPSRGGDCSMRWCGRASTRHAPVASGVFGADMQVSLINDGPVTFWLES